MPEQRDARHLIDAAEQAALAGQLATADDLLRDAARLQEAELGPLHPDLANTLNNLAIVAEKTGRPGDAEAFYRRAAAIAAAALPLDHPMRVVSRQNLEAFCRARGLPIEAPAPTTPSAQDTAVHLDVSKHDESGAATAPGRERPVAADLPMRHAEPVAATPAPSPRPPVPTTSEPLALAPPRASGPLAWLAIGGVVLVAGALLVGRPWLSTETSTAAPVAESATARMAESAPPDGVAPNLAPSAPAATAITAAPAAPPAPPPAPAATTAAAEAARVAPEQAARAALPNQISAPAPSSPDISLVTAQLCRSFSTSGGRWQCDAAGDSVAPGPIVLYTRVRSPRDAAVVHRWYRGNTLRQTVRLTIRANTTEGYRTYSRQTVDGGEDWRVEVVSADGDLLHQQRVAVR